MIPSDTIWRNKNCSDVYKSLTEHSVLDKNGEVEHKGYHWVYPFGSVWASHCVAGVGKKRQYFVDFFEEKLPDGANCHANYTEHYLLRTDDRHNSKEAESLLNSDTNRLLNREVFWRGFWEVTGGSLVNFYRRQTFHSRPHFHRRYRLWWHWGIPVPFYCLSNNALVNEVLD